MGFQDVSSFGLLLAAGLTTSAALTFGLWRHRDYVRLRRLLTLEAMRRASLVASLRESEERFRLMADNAPVVIWMSGTDKTCTYFNRGWLEMTGRTLEQELGDGWTRSVHPEDLTHCLRTYEGAFDRREPFAVEYRLRRHDGEYRWMLDMGAPRYDAQGVFLGYIGSCIDITDRFRAEQRLRELSGRLLAAQEEEFRRLARELHDDVSQQMALLAIELEQLGREPAAGPDDVSRRLHELWQRTTEISSDVYRLSHELHPSRLETLGLVATVKSCCREFSDQHHIPVQFKEDGVPQGISREIGVCVYRVVQEALRNVVRHSQATEARVRLTGDDRGLHVRISDDGAGFDAVEGEATGLGLASMRERLHVVGGDLTVESTSNGTEIEVSIPLGVRSMHPVRRR
jgi:PAS domain S-box-containing protein